MNYFLIRFKTSKSEAWHDDLRADNRETASFIAKQLQRMKAITVAYVAEYTPDGSWVRNW